MSEIKTKVNDASVIDFINAVEDQNKKQDCFTLLELFVKLTKEQPKMWGSSIIGFGQYHYKSERSRQEGDWMLTGFSPRKQNLTLYILSGPDSYDDLLENLGKYKRSQGCLYINKLEDVDMQSLENLIKKSYQDAKNRNT